MLTPLEIIPIAITGVVFLVCVSLFCFMKNLVLPCLVSSRQDTDASKEAALFDINVTVIFAIELSNLINIIFYKWISTNN